MSEPQIDPDDRAAAVDAHRAITEAIEDSRDTKRQAELQEAADAVRPQTWLRH